jgi:hypothetical protein
MYRIKLFIVIFITSALYSCGGGGGENVAANANLPSIELKQELAHNIQLGPISGATVQVFNQTIPRFSASVPMLVVREWNI